MERGGLDKACKLLVPLSVMTIPANLNSFLQRASNVAVKPSAESQCKQSRKHG